MATPAGFLSMIAVPTLFSLSLAGIWHGAGMQFVIFGLLHGSYLSINQAWRIFGGTRASSVPPGAVRRHVDHVAGVLLTFAAVLVGHVFFRSANVPSALSVLAAMAGLHHALPVALSAAPPPFRQEIAASFRWGVPADPVVPKLYGLATNKGCFCKVPGTSLAGRSS